MLALASGHNRGFSVLETARQELGISVSSWSGLEAITAWKSQLEHREAPRRAKEWCRSFRVRICRVEREYGF